VERTQIENFVVKNVQKHINQIIDMKKEIIINSPIIDFTGPTKHTTSEIEYVKWNKKKQLWKKIKTR
jgi:hypothetical protein